jgi:opacity protein-like surface antigen
LLAILALVLLQACNVVPTRFSRSGPYVGASLNYAWDDFDDLDDDIADGKLDSDSGPGWSGYAGWRILPWLGADLAFDWYDTLDVGVSDVDMQALLLQGKAYPFTGRFQPYALAGIGYLSADFKDVDYDESDWGYRLGVGLDFYIVEFLPIFAEASYTWPTGDLEDLDYVTGKIGAYFRF